MSIRLPKVFAAVVILITGFGGLFSAIAQEGSAPDYSDELNNVEKLLLDGYRFTREQVSQIEKLCTYLEDQDDPDMLMRCRFLYFLADTQLSGEGSAPRIVEADQTVLEVEEKGERRASWNSTLMIAGGGFLAAFNLFAGLSDVFYGSYLRVGDDGETIDADDLKRAAYLQATWKALDLAAWGSLTASGMSFLLGTLAAVNNPSSMGEIPPPPYKVLEDPAYERLRLQVERDELERSIHRRSSVRSIMKTGAIAGFGGSIAAGGTALVFVWLRENDLKVNDVTGAIKKEQVATALGITSANLTGISLIALLTKPSVSQLEKRLNEVDERLAELQ